MALFSDFYFISEINHFYDDRSNPGKVGATLGRQEQPSEGSASPPWLDECALAFEQTPAIIVAVSCAARVGSSNMVVS